MRELRQEEVGEEIWNIYVKALEGDPDALNQLGDRYYFGDGVEQSYDEALALYKGACRAGHVEAMYNIGFMYKEGKGVRKDYPKALDLLRRAAIEGFHKAEFHYGLMLLDGLGTEVDFPRAYDFLKRACSKGNMYAPRFIAGLHYEGRFVPRNHEKALLLYMKAAERGDSYSMNQVGYMHYYGEGCERDPAKAVQWYRRAAEAGSSDAMHNLALCLEEGSGVRRSLRRAFEWTLRAAELDHPEAMERLVRCYREGIGTAVSEGEAVKWEERLEKLAPVTERMARDEPLRSYMTPAVRNMHEHAVSGNPDAQYDLAMAFLRGNGVPQSRRTGSRWLRAAALNGSADAQYECGRRTRDEAERYGWYARAADNDHLRAIFEMGRALARGEGLERDPVRALEYFERGAELGEAVCTDWCGWMHDRCGGLERDPVLAASFYLRAAEQGNAHAMNRLGEMYAEGDGVEADWIEACLWTRCAAYIGDNMARHRLGLWHEEGLFGLRRSPEEAFRWVSLSAEDGHVPAMTTLGEYHLRGVGTEVSHGDSMTWLRRAADKGHTPAMIMIARAHQTGIGAERDLDEAMNWFETAADHGDPYGADGMGWTILKTQHSRSALMSAFEDFERAVVTRPDPCLIDDLAMTRLMLGPPAEDECDAWDYLEGVEDDEGIVDSRRGRILAGEIPVPGHHDPEAAPREFVNGAMKGDLYCIERLLDTGVPEELLDGCAVTAPFTEGLLMLLHGDTPSAVESLTRAAEADDTTAHLVLALLGFRGEADITEEEMMAHLDAANDQRSMFLTARLVLEGRIPEGGRSLEDLLLGGVELMDHRAMLLLGRCMAEGRSMRRRLAMGREWIRRSCALGCDEAMEYAEENRGTVFREDDAVFKVIDRIRVQRRMLEAGEGAE
ncbi:MAG: SEL1-like repeat protein [archaeon]|nr:SEL1-like repeat protein [archaeon]